MNDLLRRFLFYDDLAPEERRAARDAFRDALEGDDADLGRALRRWRTTRRHVARSFREDMPERRLLVLYALAGEGAPAGDALTEAERHDLDAARAQIEEALREHPAIEEIVEQIGRERDAFDIAWAEHAPTPIASETPARGDRAPRPSRAPSRPAAPRSSSSSSSSSGAKRRLAQRWGWRVAGTLAVVAFAAVLFFVAQRDLSTVTVTVAEGEAPRRIELADGSTVRLMPGGTLSYVDPEADAALDRQATLEAGRAFFDIVRQREGFVVETPTAQVTVLGTSFGVNVQARATRVVLASGRVALSARDAAGAPVTLEPGQASRVATGARPSTPMPVEDLSEALAWTGQFFFRDTPAQALADRLAAHYDRTVTVAPSLRDAEVTGTFSQERTLRQVLEPVAAALDARVRPIPDGYTLAPAGGNTP